MQNKRKLQAKSSVTRKRNKPFCYLQKKKKKWNHLEFCQHFKWLSCDDQIH